MIGAARGLQAEAEAEERPGVGEAVAVSVSLASEPSATAITSSPPTVAAETRFWPAWPVVPVLTP